jgi:hypothetical protein
MQAASRTIWILQELWWPRGETAHLHFFLSVNEVMVLTLLYECSLTKNIFLNKWKLSVTDSLPSRPFSMWWWGLSCQEVYCLSNWSRVEGDWESSIDFHSLWILFKLQFLCVCPQAAQGGRIGVGDLCWFSFLSYCLLASSTHLRLFLNFRDIIQLNMLVICLVLSEMLLSRYILFSTYRTAP